MKTLTQIDHLDLRRLMKDLTKKAVLVGVPDENADRQPDPHDPVPITNAGIGFVMEHGDPERNIPARPFLGPGVEGASKPIGDKLVATASKALDGDREAIDKGLHGVGLIAQSAVRQKIQDGPFVPLAPRTLSARKARGRTGEKPLIDTGQLRNAVNYVIR